jgi:replication factor A1
VWGFQYIFLFLYSWAMKVKITHKSDIKIWKNERSEGKLFSMDFIEESGEIRAITFNEECDKIYPFIKVT